MIQVYTQPQFPQCRMMKQILINKKIPFVEINIRENSQARETLIKKGYRATPVVITDFIGEWAGFRPDRLNQINPKHQLAR